MTKTKKPLIPPDTKRCQAEKSNGVNFMTLGGRHAMERCVFRPGYIVTEVKPGSDGRKGAMSLCLNCLMAFIKSMPDSATVREIAGKKAKP